jgi:hypothetical protein
MREHACCFNVPCSMPADAGAMAGNASAAGEKALDPAKRACPAGIAVLNDRRPARVLLPVLSSAAPRPTISTLIGNRTMIHSGRNISSLITICTGLALASPAFAHDGPHQMTYLQSLLHELAWSDTLAVTLSVAVAVVAVAAWRLCQRKAGLTKL